MLTPTACRLLLTLSLITTASAALAADAAIEAVAGVWTGSVIMPNRPIPVAATLDTRPLTRNAPAVLTWGEPHRCANSLEYATEASGAITLAINQGSDGMCDRLVGGYVTATHACGTLTVRFLDSKGRPQYDASLSREQK